MQNKGIVIIIIIHRAYMYVIVILSITLMQFELDLFFIQRGLDSAHMPHYYVGE